MTNKYVNISRGPQFKQGKSFILFFLILSLVVFAIMLIGSHQIIPAIIFLFLSIFLVFNMIDIQGVQVDKKNNLVRNYKLRLWGKLGKWSDLNKFHSIYLDFTTYKINSKSFYTEMISTSPNLNKTELHGHFVIILMHKNENKSLILSEKFNYKSAKILAEEYSKKIGLPFRNIIIERARKSKFSKRN